MTRDKLMIAWVIVSTIGLPNSVRAQQMSPSATTRDGLSASTGAQPNRASSGAEPINSGPRDPAIQPSVNPTPAGTTSVNEKLAGAEAKLEANSQETPSLASANPELTPTSTTHLNRDDYSGPPNWFKTPPTIGAYGGPTLAYSRLAHKNGALIGIEGALLFDHRFSLGLVGYQWATETHASPDATTGAPQNLEVSYGGLVVRYAALTDRVVYGAIGLVAGAGAGKLVHPDEPSDSSTPRSRIDTFFVVEPQLSLHSNVTRWMRITLQAGYRLTAGVGRFGYSEGDYNGITLGGALQFGWF